MFERARAWWQRFTGQPPAAEGASDSDGERRGWERLPSSAATTLTPVGGTDQPTLARVRNVSRGGIGLLVEQAVEIGSLVNLELRKTAGDAARTILACVVHVVAHPDEQWTLGCNFIRELSDADLRALL